MVYSQSCIRQTLLSLVGAGIGVFASDDLRYIHIEPSDYHPRDVTVYEDYTSASYPLAVATLFPGRSVFSGVHGDSQHGERVIIPIIEQLGMIRFEDIRLSFPDFLARWRQAGIRATVRDPAGERPAEQECGHRLVPPRDYLERLKR